jgi:hypothetical protein
VKNRDGIFELLRHDEFLRAMRSTKNTDCLCEVMRTSFLAAIIRPAVCAVQRIAAQAIVH